MLNAGQAGFVNAPVTKTIVATVVLITVFGSVIESQARFTLHIDAVLRAFQFWRLFTHHLVFTTPGELLFGVVLLYFFRQFERQLGSSRYAALALTTSSIYTVLLFTLQMIDVRLTAASGPYSLIFASLIHFFFETPKIYHFQLLGILDLSDKTFIYLLAIQLVFSMPPRSFISCVSALIAGILFRIPVMRNNADIPEPIVQFFSAHVLPWLGTAPRHPVFRRSRSAARQARVTAAVNGLLDASARTQDAQAGDEIVPDTVVVEDVIDEHVEMLVSMGFSRENSIAALRRTRNDVQAATEILLRGTNNT